MSTLQPIQPVRISHNVYEAVEAAIINGELGPGSAISDRHLAELLQVSRTPVRDALHQLESNGLVERRGRSGWVVAGFTERDIHELFELRRIWEPIGLEHLGRTWDDKSVQRLGSFFDEFPVPLPQSAYTRFLEYDGEFHKLIVRFSENSRIISFYGVIEKQIDRMRHFLSLGSKGRIDQVQTEHSEICKAIAAHDLDKATAALLYHLSMGEQNMVRFLHERETSQGDRKERA